MEKEISVVMGAYREKPAFLRKAIESILSQTYPGFEYFIVLDDPDNSELEEIILQYAEKDDRIIFLKNEKNMGVGASANRAMAMAKYPYIARMDADDISDPERFEKQLAFLKAHPDYKAVTCKLITMDEEEHILSYGSALPDTFEKIRRGMAFINIVAQNGTMFDKDFVQSLGGYRKMEPAEDHDLWLRMLAAGGKIGAVDEYLMRYRLGEGNISIRKAMEQWYADKYARSLYRERLKKGKDSFSPEALRQYLQKHHCFEEKHRERFYRGNLLFREARVQARSRHYFRALGGLLHAVVVCPAIMDIIMTSVRYKLSVR